MHKKQNVPLLLVTILILITILTITFFPLFQGKVLLPLDILNNLYYPYQTGDINNSPPEVFNHYVNDSIRVYYPAKIFLKKSITSHQSPLWNPLAFGGYPFYAESTQAIFDPFNIFLFFSKTIIGVEIAILLQLLLAGFSMYLLMKEFNISHIASLMGSIGYMLNGLFVVTIYHEWMLGAFCWVPLIFLMVLKWFKRNDFKYYFFAAIFMTFSHLGGNLQISSYIIFLFIFYFVYERYILLRLNNKMFIAAILLPVISLFLCAFVLFPTIQAFFLDVSGRTKGTREMHSFLHMICILPILFLNLFNNSLIGSVRGFELIKLWGPGMDEFNIFCGFAVAFFAFWAFLKKRENYFVKFFIFLSLTAIALPLFTPLYKFIYYRVLILLIFSFCIVSGIGFDSFFSEDNFKLKLRYTCHILIAIICLLAGVLVTQIVVNLNYEHLKKMANTYIEGKISTKFFGPYKLFYLKRVENLLQYYKLNNPVILFSNLSIIGTLLLIILSMHKKISFKSAKTAVCVLLSLEMIIFARSFITFSDLQKNPMYKNLSVIKLLKKDKGIWRVFLINHVYKELPVFYPNVLMAYGIETVQGDESYYPHNLKYFDKRFLNLINAKYLISHNYIEPRDNLILIYDGVVKLYKNKTVMPRAFCIYSYKVVKEPGNQLKELKSKYFDYSKYAVVSSPLPFVSQNPPQRYNSFSSVFIKDYKQGYIKLEVDNSRDSLLVISNTYYPGWEAKVNGVKEQIQRVNYCMQGIYLPPGKHLVELKFSPRIFKLSSILSILTFLSGSILLFKKTKPHF